MGMTVPIIGEQDVRARMLHAEVLTRKLTRSRAKTGVEAKRPILLLCDAGKNPT